MSPYFFAEGFETSDGRIIGLDHVLPGYFETAGVPLLRGRLLDSRDLRSNADVAVMSETAARTVFPDGDAIGRTFSSARGRSLTVVGIVGDVFQSFAWDAPPVAYVIPAAATDGYMHLLVRVRTREPGTLAEIRREAGVLTPGEPVTAAWWSDTLSGLTPYRQPRFQTLVLGAFAALALGLTALGIFAIVAFLVASRTREMGVRMALGATPRSLVRLVVRQAFASVAVGIVLGLVAVYWLRSVATSQVVGLDVGNPLTLAAAVVTVIAAALLAAWLPARRAGRVPLVDLLRAD
jgi:putative ABC transport system permease protein